MLGEGLLLVAPAPIGLVSLKRCLDILRTRRLQSLILLVNLLRWNVLLNTVFILHGAGSVPVERGVLLCAGYLVETIDGLRLLLRKCQVGSLRALNAVPVRLFNGNLLRRLFLGQKVKHFIVEADVVALQICVCFVSLEVDAESGELLESLGLPTIFVLPQMHLLLHRVSHVLQKCKTLRVDSLVGGLVATLASVVLLKKRQTV